MEHRRHGALWPTLVLILQHKEHRAVLQVEVTHKPVGFTGPRDENEDAKMGVTKEQGGCVTSQLMTESMQKQGFYLASHHASRQITLNPRPASSKTS